MNKSVAILCRLLGLRRRAPKTRLGRCLRRSERLFSVLLLLYLGLHLYPQVLFAHSVSVDGIALYSRGPLPPEAAACARQVAALVQRSELAVAGRHERVFICDRAWLYRLFHPLGRGAFGASMSLTDHVFIAGADFPRGLAVRPAADFNTRSLAGVIAHEITHGLIRHRVGFFAALRLPDWVAEGYCEYVAGEGSFPDGEGFRRLIQGDDHPSGSFRYFLYRQMVTYLIDQRGLNFAKIVALARDREAVERQTRLALQSR